MWVDCNISGYNCSMIKTTVKPEATQGKHKKWLLSKVNIRTKLKFGNILFGCLRQVGCLIEVTANSGLTVFHSKRVLKEHSYCMSSCTYFVCSVWLVLIVFCCFILFIEFGDEACVNKKSTPPTCFVLSPDIQSVLWMLPGVRTQHSQA